VARAIEKLSPASVTKTTTPGLHGDGAGLWLHVGPHAGEKTGKSWIFRFTMAGKAHEMGLGPLHTIGLAKARQLARECREMRLAGVNPLEARNDRRAGAKLDAAKAITFKTCADNYIRAHRAGWRNAKHAAQWAATLATYAYPIVGDLPVAAINTGHVTHILEPIWAAKPETAGRLRGRVEAVLDYARTHGWRDGENPARWKNHLENVLPKLSSVKRVEHHAALPWGEMAVFMRELAERNGIGALALRFAILTACRTGEAIGAWWSEIDPDAAVWTLPEARTKSARQHRIPLSEGALNVLREAAALRDAPLADGFVFPGAKPGKPLGDTALLDTLAQMGRRDITPHGFRSTFRDWCAETGQAADVAEAALAHLAGDKTVVAYQRGDLLARRARLMQAWADFVLGNRGAVVQLSAS
jgi:integrase